MYEYYGNNKNPQNENNEITSTNAKKSKKGSIAKLIASGLVFGIVAGGSFQGISLASDLVRTKLNIDRQSLEASAQDDAQDVTKENKDTSSNNEKSENKTDKKDGVKVQKSDDNMITQVDTREAGDVAAVAAKVMPSIVSITNKSVQEVRSMFGYGVQEYESESCGSGIIIGQNEDELLLVTNNHVVEGANTLTVGFIDDEIYEAVIKGTDADNDLAVIAVKLSDISSSTMDKISVATIGDSDDLVIGQQVVAIGNALGIGQSVTTGIISALNCDIAMEKLSNELIQTDAAINPGNSGGALLNMKGEVIGINSAKLASAKIEGMGYAIPISSATPIIEELMNRQTRELVDEAKASYLGISGVSVTDEVSQTYGIPQGVYISEADENGPAGQAGITKGDVIKKFDGVTVRSINDIKDQLQYYEAGETIEILLERQEGEEYKEMTVEVTLGKKSDSVLSNSAQSDTEPSPDESNQNNESNQFSGNMIDPFSFFGY